MDADEAALRRKIAELSSSLAINSPMLQGIGAEEAEEAEEAEGVGVVGVGGGEARRW